MPLFAGMASPLSGPPNDRVARPRNVKIQEVDHLEILLVEDNPQDAEHTMSGLRESSWPTISCG